MEHTESRLMSQRWRRRHELLAVDDLVPLAIVGHVEKIVRRPLPPRRVHVHTI